MMSNELYCMTNIKISARLMVVGPNLSSDNFFVDA